MDDMKKGIVDPKLHNYEKEWKDYRFLLTFNPKTAEVAYKEYEFEKDSVIIASFPKSGNG